MNELLVWLRAQLDEDERLIAEHPDGEDYGDGGRGIWAEEESNYPCAPYLRISKARALADLAVKRGLVDAIAAFTAPIRASEMAGAQGEFSAIRAQYARIARELTPPYVGRPGYREEWRP